MLLRGAVPSQNLPASLYERKKNVAQMENRARRLANRNAMQATVTPPSTALVTQNLSIVKVESMKETAVKKTAKPSKPQRKKPTNKRNVEQTVQPSEPSRGLVNVMDFLKTRSKLYAWTGIQTFFLLRKIEEKISTTTMGHNALLETTELTLLECILLCCIRMKTKLSFVCLTSIFNVSSSVASKIFHIAVPHIRAALEDEIFFSSVFESEEKSPVTLRMFGYDEILALVESNDEFEENSKCKSEPLCAIPGIAGGSTAQQTIKLEPPIDIIET